MRLDKVTESLNLLQSWPREHLGDVIWSRLLKSVASQRHRVERFLTAGAKCCRSSLTWHPGTGPRAPPWAAVIGPSTHLVSANRVNNAGDGRVDRRARELCK